ncbi:MULTISPECIES: DUF2147 domain-containing protein [Tenacibaculum]|uniref:DUF2147 domain-containing protein n=1 Tax=Tenacibaculum aiptasiae TaxID=426481 RepID=A0A7J5ACH5_9FLAO|nr:MULTISPECIES: DUF2147 domain-containing protein [Tenacibaculum]KAB1155276.1 DUF2147 domain-containing protein [Tenacibaculum aiptasiae]MCF2873379.1 hypothetical protein [Tenacibaculum sp. Cn5-1]MCF2933535.1 hypothetical protein [Tenacibaculum sp. Cn5-34]MCG7509883.1 hypothetical protein [Tenacibaculum sp. Cn5-46]
MKRYLFGLLIFLIGCSTQIDERILGIWDVQSSFYKATYKIEKQANKLVGKVIYYNDDTTIIRETGTDKDIFLNNLTYKDDTFVDAISGATQTNSDNLKIKIKHKDTLEVTSYIMHKPLIEIWVRKQ